MLPVLQKTPLQVQGLAFTVVPAMKVHALAAKQMHLLLLLQASVEVG